MWGRDLGSLGPDGLLVGGHQDRKSTPFPAQIFQSCGSIFALAKRGISRLQGRMTAAVRKSGEILITTPSEPADYLRQRRRAC